MPGTPTHYRRIRGFHYRVTSRTIYPTLCASDRDETAKKQAKRALPLCFQRRSRFETQIVGLLALNDYDHLYWSGSFDTPLVEGVNIFCYVNQMFFNRGR